MEQLIGFKTCLKTLPGFLPAHLTSQPLNKNKHTVQAHLCSTVCVPGTLMKDEEPKPCQILSSQAAKPPGPRLLAVARHLGFQGFQGLGLLSCWLLCSSVVMSTRNRETRAMKLSASKLWGSLFNRGYGWLLVTSPQQKPDSSGSGVILNCDTLTFLKNLKPFFSTFYI